MKRITVILTVLILSLVLSLTGYAADRNKAVADAASSDQSTFDEATPDYQLNLRDPGNSWVYILIAVLSTGAVITAAAVISKKVK